MDSNVGEKIKNSAIIYRWIGIAFFIITGVILLFTGAVFVAIVEVFTGIGIVMLSSLVLYGFGQLIENTQVLRERIEDDSDNKKMFVEQLKVKKRNEVSSVNSKYDNEVTDDIVAKMIEGKIVELENQKKAGKITIEEFDEYLKQLKSK
ncbi:MAG: hypothetical protein IKU82_07055 [Clostridia bacterium]|nr:hypothetical protein [Clostridia bacterium]